MCGTLWVVGTPLGNKEDISSRAIEVLSSVDSVLAEDTRITKKLFSLLGIQIPPLYSFCDYTEEKKIKTVVGLLEEGKNIALVSDAGMPTISDPGYHLVRACHRNKIQVRVVPGPSSIITALAGSGIGVIPFTFVGFLPRGRGERETLFSSFQSFDSSIVFFERKNRVIESLKIAYTVLGERDICIARELTKIYEEYISMPLSESIAYSKELQGEITVVIGKAQGTYKTPIEKVLEVEKSLAVSGSFREHIKALQSKVNGYTVKELYTLLEENKKKEKE